MGRDPRPLLRVVYDVYKSAGVGGSGEKEEEGGGEDPADRILAAGEGRSPHDVFYAKLYAALWCEATGEDGRAKDLMVAATETPYARGSGDYMAGEIVRCGSRERFACDGSVLTTCSRTRAHALRCERVALELKKGGLSDPPVNESDVALERRVLRDESPADDFIEAFLSSPPQTGLGSRRTQAIPTQKAHHKL